MNHRKIILLFLFGIIVHPEVFFTEASDIPENSTRNHSLMGFKWFHTFDKIPTPPHLFDEECVPPPEVIPPEDDLSKLSLWELLEKTEKQLEIHEGDAVLLMGNTGGGKTTVALTITGDLKNLTAHPVGKKLILVDANQKIGITTASRTLVPELFPDDKNNLFFYDFPGFLDNREMKSDITANYLMKKATENLSSVRIAFIVSEESVTIGGSKTDFGLLVNSAIRVMRDMAKFQSGIGMIITKVDNKDWNENFRNDTVVLSGITNFLQDYKRTEEEKLNAMRSNSFSRRPKVFEFIPWWKSRSSSISSSKETDTEADIRKRIQFVSILLQENKISIFRNPDKCGSFDQSTWSQESKDGMTRLVRDQLKRVPCTSQDFGYAISPDTAWKIIDLYKDLNQNMTDLMTSLVSELRRAHLQSTGAIKEFQPVKEWIDADHGNFSAVIDRLKNSESPGEFGRAMYSALTSRGYDQKWGTRFKEQSEMVESYMDFFDVIGPKNETYERRPSDWVKPLELWVGQELVGRREWYDFIFNLRNAYSVYEVQSTKPSSIPKDISGIKDSLGKNHNFIVTDKIIKLFNNDPIEVLTKDDLNILWEIVEEAFEVPTIECDSGDQSQMIVKGTFVKTSDFSNDQGDLEGCPSSQPPPQVVVVHATRKFFVDRSLSPEKSPGIVYELGFVSPSWEVVGRVQIDVGGSDGPNGEEMKRGNRMSSSIERSHPTPLRILRITNNDLPWHTGYVCAQKGETPAGEQGSSGRPGGHGFPGGHVLGLLGSIDGAEGLSIIASGGNGGTGQGGASGSEGGKGKEIIFDEWPQCSNGGPREEQCPNELKECKRGYTWDRYFDTCWRKLSGAIECKKYGCVGGVGGRGGDGGAGGLGGSGGRITLVGGSSESSPVQIAEASVGAGRNGSDGSGGGGGLGGLRADGVLANADFELGGACKWENVKYNQKSFERATTGDNGESGANRDGQGNLVEQPEFILNQADLILAFNEVSLSKDSIYFPTGPFIDDLYEKSPEIRSNYSQLHFAAELLQLERANLLLKNKKVSRDSLSLRMIRKYESLLWRLERFAQDNRLSDPGRKFVSLLYSTAFIQVRTLKQVMGTPMIVDVAGYLETVDRRLQTYTDTEQIVLVDAERERYRETFETKIEEAMKFIIETVEPSIDGTYEDLGEVTQELVEAIDKMIAAAEEAQKEYDEAVKSAKNKMALRGLFSILSAGASIIGLVGGPAGAAVGGIIGGAVSIGENVALGEGSEIRPPTPLPDSIKKYAALMEAKVKATSQERQDELDILISESRVAASENKEMLGGVTKTIDTLERDKKRLLEDGPKGSLKEWQELNKKVGQSEQELVKLLEHTLDLIKKKQEGLAGTPEEQEEAKKFGDKAIERLNQVNQAVSIVSKLGMDIYNKHRNDKKELERLEKMALEAAEQVEDLKNYEKAVNELLVPFTDSVIGDLDEAQKAMEGGSAVFLRVQKWQVGKILRQYNFFLQDFSQAFPDIAKQYALQVEELQEAMTLMIDLYVFVEQYNEQMQFADYIANINSRRGLAADIGPNESAIYNKIQMALLGSTILSEWDAVIQSFQQWVFPFSDEFHGVLDTSNIPDYLKPEITTPEDIFGFLLPSIRKRVCDLSIALDQYKSATFPAIDNQLFKSPFNSDQTSTVPFFVWKWESNEEKLRDLLSGKQVTLSASPEFTYKWNMSAVKFTVAEIEPKVRANTNETIGEELKSLLKQLRVWMVHSGVSRYVFEDGDYEMIGGQQVLQYNFERGPDGQRLQTNNIYDKIQKGDMILSPYTLWSAQLFKVRNDVPFDFAQLANLTRFVDLELIGHGSFVSKKGSRKDARRWPGAIPLHYYRFQLSGLPNLNVNSAVQRLLM